MQLIHRIQIKIASWR